MHRVACLPDLVAFRAVRGKEEERPPVSAEQRDWTARQNIGGDSLPNPRGGQAVVFGLAAGEAVLPGLRLIGPKKRLSPVAALRKDIARDAFVRVGAGRQDGAAFL